MEACQFDRADIVARYTARFGRGWRTELCRVTGIDATQMSRLRPPTLRTIGLLLEWIEATEEICWPERYARLREMSEAQRDA